MLSSTIAHYALLCNSELDDVKDRALCYLIFTQLVKQHQFIRWYASTCAAAASDLRQDRFTTTGIVQVVWSSMRAAGAFSFTDLMPFMALALVV
jgi:hypothetical protein